MEILNAIFTNVLVCFDQLKGMHASPRCLLFFYLLFWYASFPFENFLEKMKVLKFSFMFFFTDWHNFYFLEMLKSSFLVHQKLAFETANINAKSSVSFKINYVDADIDGNETYLYVISWL